MTGPPRIRHARLARWSGPATWCQHWVIAHQQVYERADGMTICGACWQAARGTALPPKRRPRL